MDGELFAKRLADVRKRFAAKLPGRIAAIGHALPELAGEGGEVAAAVRCMIYAASARRSASWPPAKRRESAKKSCCNRPVANAGLPNRNWRI
jgi:hypothetical protein